MNRFRNKKGSIYGQLAWLLIAAFILSVVFFIILNRSGNYLINYFMTHTDYLEKEDNKRIDMLQTYITNQKIASTDSKRLTDWVNDQAVIAVQIYKNGFLVYDSNYPEEDFGEEAPDRHYSWETFYTLLFADGKAEVILYGFYDYQFYNYALVGSLNTMTSAYFYSTKRSGQAIALNIVRSLIMNSLIITFLPKIFGNAIVWHTFGIYEVLVLILAVALKKGSERKGIVYK